MESSEESMSIRNDDREEPSTNKKFHTSLKKKMSRVQEEQEGSGEESDEADVVFKKRCIKKKSSEK